MTTDERIRAFLQELEAEEGDDLITGFVLITKRAIADDPDVTGYQLHCLGSIDEQIGLLRYATVKAEAAVTSNHEEE